MYRPMSDVQGGSVNHPDAAPASLLEEARRELCAEILRGHGGRAALGRYSERLDVLLRSLVDAAGRSSHSVALVATGGYGRRQLCLHSDVDLLVLFGGSIDDADERL